MMSALEGSPPIGGGAGWEGEDWQANGWHDAIRPQTPGEPNR